MKRRKRTQRHVRRLTRRPAAARRLLPALLLFLMPPRCSVYARGPGAVVSSPRFALMLIGARASSQAIELLELEEEAPPEELDSTEPERGDLAVCLSNRAACWLRRKQWRQALADCNRVIRSGCVLGKIVSSSQHRQPHDLL